MTPEQMRRALELDQRATSLRCQYETYVLAKCIYGSSKEVINIGTPRKDGTLDPTTVEIPEEARRHVFNLWRRGVALKHNACVRELAQLGASTTHRLIEL